MNIRHDVRVDVHVVLSKRNLDTLRAMLDHPEVTGTTLYRQTPNGSLAVTVESDADHYDDVLGEYLNGSVNDNDW